MAVSKVTVGSTIAVQSLPAAVPVPPIGPLPDASTVRGTVPVRPVQDDALFVRESIGSATLEGRLDIDVPDESIALTGCRNRSGVEFGLSVDRPVVLASLDVLSRFADEETIKKSIDQNLTLAEFESELLKSDYDFVMEKVKASNEGVVQGLQDALASEDDKLKIALDQLAEIAVGADRVSRELDFIRPENSFRDRVDSTLNGYNFRFDESRPSADSLVTTSARETSSSTIARLKDDIDSIPLTRAESDLINKLRFDGTALSDQSSNSDSRYTGKSYDSLSHSEKTLVCCKVLSRIMAATFSKAKFPDGFGSVRLPVTVGSLGAASSFLFESNDASISGSIAQGDSLASRLALSSAASNLLSVELDADSFSPEKSKKNNNFDSIILKILQSDGPTSIRQLESVKASFREAKELLKYRRAAGLPDEAGSPQDVLLMVLSQVADSFPTYSSATAQNSSVSTSEMVDALVMSLGCRKSRANDGITGLYRSIILTSIQDSDYKFGDVDPEVFDSTSESKTITDSGDGSKTIRASSGTNTKGKGKVSETSSASGLYETLNKRGLIPPLARQFVKAYLDLMEEEGLSKDDGYKASVFAYSILAYYGNLTNLPYNLEKIPSNSVVLAPAREQPKAPVIRTLDPSVGGKVSKSREIYESIRNYGLKDSSTVKVSVLALYSKLLETFKSNYGVEINEEEFTTGGSTTLLKKSVILDLVFECLSNCLVWTVNPAIMQGEAEIDSVLEEEGAAGWTVEELETRAQTRISSGVSATDAQRILDRLSQVSSIFILSRNLSNLQPIGSIVASGDLVLYESIRNLSMMKRLQTVRGNFTQFALSYPTDFERIKDLKASAFARGFSEGTLDCLKVFKLQLASMFSDGSDSLLEEYRETVRNLSLLDSVSDIIDLSVSSLLRLQQTSTSLRDSLATFSREQKSDVFKCLSLPSVTAALLKRDARIVNDARGFENSYSRNRPSLDVSAARWFFKNYPIDAYERSRLVFFGLPQGFTSGLTRQARTLDDNFLIVDEDAVPNTNPKYFEASITVRPVQVSNTTYEIELNVFHPFIHVSQREEIDVSRDATGLFLRNRFDVHLFDRTKWQKMNSASSTDVEKIKKALGLSGPSDVNKLIDSHIRSSIFASVARVLSALDINSDALGTYRKAMSRADAGKITQLIAADTASVIPRGSMAATDFMNQRGDGFIESIPFSMLAGSAPDLTNPSDHGLLMKFLDTRTFNAATLSREVLLPSAFERVYCALLNNEDIVDPRELLGPADSGVSYEEGKKASQTAKSLNISQIAIKAVR